MDRFIKQPFNNSNENKRIKHDREKSAYPASSQSWIVENIRSIITSKDEDTNDELNTTLTSIKTSDLEESISTEPPVHPLSFPQHSSSANNLRNQFGQFTNQRYTCFDSDIENRRACLAESHEPFNDKILKRALSPEIVQSEAAYAQKIPHNPLANHYNLQALEFGLPEFNHSNIFDCNSNYVNTFNDPHFYDTSVKRKKIVPNANAQASNNSQYRHMISRFDEPKMLDYSGFNNLSQSSMLNNAFLHTSSGNSSFSLQPNDSLPEASPVPSQLIKLLENSISQYPSNKWSGESNCSYNYGPTNSSINDDENQIPFPLSPFSGEFKSHEYSHENLNFVSARPPKPMSDKSNYFKSQPKQFFSQNNNQMYANNYDRNFNKQTHQNIYSNQYNYGMNEPKFHNNVNMNQNGNQKIFKSSTTLFKENKSSQNYVSHSISSDNVSSLRGQDLKSSFQSKFNKGSNYDLRANPIDENKFMASSNDTSTCSSNGSNAKETVILHVKNLDYKISADEWKRILSENFKKHCKDVSVLIKNLKFFFFSFLFFYLKKRL